MLVLPKHSCSLGKAGLSKSARPSLRRTKHLPSSPPIITSNQPWQKGGLCHESQPTLISPRANRGRIQSLGSQTRDKWMTARVNLGERPATETWIIHPTSCGGKEPLCSQAIADVITPLRGLQAARNPLLVNKENERFNNCFCSGCLVKALSLGNETKGD